MSERESSNYERQHEQLNQIYKFMAIDKLQINKIQAEIDNLKKTYTNQVKILTAQMQEKTAKFQKWSLVFFSDVTF